MKYQEWRNNLMNFIICIEKKGKAKIIGKSNTLNTLTLITALCNAIAEKIQKEKGIDKERAIKFVTNAILEGYKKMG